MGILNRNEVKCFPSFLQPSKHEFGKTWRKNRFLLYVRERLDFSDTPLPEGSLGVQPANRVCREGRGKMLDVSCKSQWQMCSVQFSWKLIKVSCPVLISTAVFCPLWSEQDLQIANECWGTSVCGSQGKCLLHYNHNFIVPFLCLYPLKHP